MDSNKPREITCGRLRVVTRVHGIRKLVRSLLLVTDIFDDAFVGSF